MDFVIYMQHVMFHAIPIFWRIHRMRHADLDFDVTTGIRFHFFEIILSLVVYYETNSNFGFNLPLWGRFLGTYRDQPRMGHEGMTIGLWNFHDTKRCAILPGMLPIPFLGKEGGYTIDRRK